MLYFITTDENTHREHERMVHMKRTSIKKTFCAALAVAAIAVIPATGISAIEAVSPSSAASSAASDNAAKPVKPAKQPMKFGKVTSVSGSSITVVIGDMERGGKMKGGCKDGTAPAADGTANSAPAAPDGTTPPTDGTTPPTDGTTPPADGTRPEKPAGEMPTGEKPDISSMITWTDTSVTIDASAVKITKDGKEASVSDIAQGDILTLIYKDDAVTEIAIGAQPHMHGPKGGRRGGRRDPADTTGTASAAAPVINAVQT